MTTDLQTKGPDALSIGGEKGASLRTGFDPNDLKIPRAVLLQFTQPRGLDVDYTKDKHRPGMVIDSLTLEKLPATFIPVFVRTKWIRFNAQQADKPGYDENFELGAKMWEATDPLDERVQKEGQWGPNNEPPLASKFLEFFCLFEGLPMPVIVSFTKTSLDAGKQLLTLAQFGGPQMYSNRYELGVKQETNKAEQKYFVYTVKRLGAVTAEQAQFCQTLFEVFSKASLNVDDRVHDGAEAGAKDERPF